MKKDTKIIYLIVKEVCYGYEGYETHLISYSHDLPLAQKKAKHLAEVSSIEGEGTCYVVCRVSELDQAVLQENDPENTHTYEVEG